MTLLYRVTACLPALHVGLMLAALAWTLATPFGVRLLLPLAALLAAAYVVPPAAHRLLAASGRLDERRANLSEPVFEPWMASLLLQMSYSYLPFLEALLRVVPGLYSVWLRGWGSRIGTRVFWAPGVRILDRSLMEVGDRTVFGTDCMVSSHLIFKRDGVEWIHVKRVKIGADCLIGAGSMIAHGVRIGERVEVGTGVLMGPLVRIGSGAVIGPAAGIETGGRVAAGAVIPPGLITKGAIPASPAQARTPG
ncbi:DapH/DapD/GlmU-related protein [Acuticoccus mangrovi]|uniref:Acetyltransferase n=1 Tax=Acuticoccus mangrovi TaxID=2796142 RepID=A0A934MNG1_9HYPH|nr:hypothetical protein [Acuticoccus mangrovi]